MFAFFQRILDWFKSLFWKEEMELTLVGLQYSGKTTFVNVIAVSSWLDNLLKSKNKDEIFNIIKLQFHVFVHSCHDYELHQPPFASLLTLVM